MKHNKTMAGLKLIHVVWFTVCFGVALMLCLLHLTNVINISTPLAAVVSLKQVARYPFGKQDHCQIHSLINTMTRPANSNKDQDEHVSQMAHISCSLQDFRHEWLRQRRARVDWMNIIRPCADQMAWGSVKDNWGKKNRSNAATSDVKFKDIRPAGEFSKIFIQSKTSDNRTKVIGGDTWRVYLRGPSSVAATVFDHNNGTYEALFLITEPGVYQLMVYLDYSLCDGFRDPPHDWFIKGNDQGEGQEDGILGPLDEYLVKQPFKNGLSLNISIAKARLNMSLLDKLEGLDTCSHSCRFLWDGFGQWKNNQWKQHLEESYTWSMPQNYTKSGTFWIYGDSLGLLFFRSVRNQSLCKSLYEQCKNSYIYIYPFGKAGKNSDLDFKPSKVIETIVKVLRRPEMQKEESALLLNLVVHFVKDVNFTTYQKLIDDLIVVLKETEVNPQGERVPKYKAKIIWKSSTAICKENAKSLNKTSFRFFTTQRVALFSAYSMSAMCKAGFDVIDVYPLTDSYPLRCRDHVHYSDQVFGMLERMLEQYKVHNNKGPERNERNGKIKRCISQEEF
ncbi:uncharacterized protein LOC144634826 isoform X1 [Oculina patagonica]